jgi:hypothetical protein
MNASPRPTGKLDHAHKRSILIHILDAQRVALEQSWISVVQWTTLDRNRVKKVSEEREARNS